MHLFWGRSAVLPLQKSTLVLYVFSYTDPEFLNNLRYFIKQAINPNDHCDYVISVQLGKNMKVRNAQGSLYELSSRWL